MCAPQFLDSLRPVLCVLGLDGESKMSKSKNNEIGLFETQDEVMAKLRGAKTDPARLRRSDPGNPSVCNVFSYHGYFTDDETRAQIDRDCRAAEIGCVDCKKILAERMERVLGPIRERAAELLHQAQLAKTLGVPFRKIQSMIHIYPTYGDLVKRPATAAFADRLQNNFFVKQLRRLAS